ncbi:hypothetical protein [Glutamicibacter ardleyensis]|jgi:hypothetical protein|uniref:hypothetical protein n=1 Tax=Glutamicibacter ardleyensis TaxID=225894 RepID=UPI003FCF31E9
MHNAPSILINSNKSPFEKSERTIFGGIQIANTSLRLATNKAKVIGVHGNGVMAGSWVSEIEHAQRILDSTTMTYPEIGKTVRGSLTIYIIDPTMQSVVVLTDPIGAGLVYIYQSNGITAVSSDMNSLRFALRNQGISLEKNLAYTATYVASGSGGLTQSSYKGVEVLAPNTYLVVSSYEVCKETYDNNLNLSLPNLTYEDLLDKAANDIVKNIEATLTHDTHVRISQLTGGVDSRLVLGALISSGHANKFSFFCAGFDQEPDKVIARQLTSHLGLTMTEFSGLSPYESPTSFNDLVSRPFHETGGIISGPASPFLKQQTNLVLAGGYGEFLRSFYDKNELFNGNYPLALEQMYSKTSFSQISSRRLVSSEVYRESLNSLENMVNLGTSIGVPKEYSLDGAYILGRNRYYVGEISRSLSPYAARFDPLYSPYITALGLRQEPEAKNANVPGFDLMNRFDPSLSRLPFDTERITPSYEKYRGQVRRLNFNSGADVLPRMKNYSNGQEQSHVHPSFHPRPSKRDIEVAQQLRTAPRLVSQNSEVRLNLGKLISHYGMKNLSNYFNPLILNQLVTKEPTHRVHLRQASNLYSALLWHSSDSQ